MSKLINRVFLNQYRVDSFVASGGMGSVYRVWDLRRNVALAMKVLHSELADDPHIFKRFQREANALKRLTHPNIVQFYGLFHSLDIVFLLERFVDGPSLKDILRQKKRLSFQEALIYLKALCAALGYAHASGVVHCDVKPGNILLDQGGTIYLTDFGIARHAESTTTTMATAGTAAYMAPEQIRGEPVTPATDVYALGIMLFEMLTGKRPFRGNEQGTERGGETANERIRYAHLHVQPPDPRSLDLSIPHELAQTIQRALNKNPARRYRSMQEFLTAILAAANISSTEVADRVVLPPNFQGTTLPSQPGSDAQQARTNQPFTPRKAIAWLAGTITLVLIAFVLFSRLNTPENRPDPPAFQNELADFLPPATATKPVTATVMNTSAPTNTVTPHVASSYQQGKIAYVMRNAAKTYFLYFMDLAHGSEPELLLEPDRPTQSRYYAPWFGPDGQMLAYDDFYLGKTFVMDFGSPGDQLVLGTCASPSFSPDGEHLVCSQSGRDYFPVFEVKSGAVVDKIYHGMTGAVLPAWSPDGSEIAFSVLKGKGMASIWKVKVGGGDPVPLATDANEDYAPAWSPDSKWIAFQSTRRSNKSEVWVMRRNGKGKKQITKSGGGEIWSRGPCFSPDGQWLAFVSNQGKVGVPDFGDVFVISLLTGEQRQITFTDGSVLDWRVTWSK
jgi:serine/threonine protein kinase